MRLGFRGFLELVNVNCEAKSLFTSLAATTQLLLRSVGIERAVHQFLFIRQLMIFLKIYLFNVHDLRTKTSFIFHYNLG